MRKQALAIVVLAGMGACSRSNRTTPPAASASASSASLVDAAPPVPAATAGFDGVCHGHWCWEDPLPTGDDLVDVVVAGPDDAWVVASAAEDTAFLHWSGKTVTRSFANRRATALARVAADDLWATTSAGVMLHSDGATWSEVAFGNTLSLDSIWASGPNDIWAVGTSGAIAHFDGKAWSSTTSPTKNPLHVVRGRAADDVWAAGDGVILHFDGKKWSDARKVDMGPLARPAPPPSWCGTPAEGVKSYNESLTKIRSIVPLAANDVWFASVPGRTLHFTGGAWQEGDIKQFGAEAMWATGPNDVWVAGSGVSHWDGSAWTAVVRPADASLVAIGGTGPKDVWAVGRLGTILRYDGTEWTHVDVGNHARLTGLWVGADAAWAVGEGTILKRGDRRWMSVPLPADTNGRFTAIGGASASSLWAFAAFDEPLRGDGVTWTKQPPTPERMVVFEVYAPADDDVWAVGALSIQHWDGKSWHDLSKGEFLIEQLWTPSKGVAWGTAHPRPLRRTPTSTVTGYDFGSVVLVRWDGGKFVNVVRVPDDTASAIGGLGSDVWVAGNAKVQRWDGKAWSMLHEIPKPPGWLGGIGGMKRPVAVLDANEAWVGVEDGLLHREGATWTKDSPPVSGVVVHDRDVWAYGPYGGIVRWKR